MFGWIPVVLGLFAVLPARVAVVTGFTVAWLFLPPARYEIVGFPEYDKMFATCLGVLLGLLLFSRDRPRAPSLSRMDLPMAVFCLSPILSSLDNGLGLYDGLSTALELCIVWGMPYTIGRAFFQDGDLRLPALALLLGGLVYVPLCLLEVRLSPQLNQWIYGFQQHSFLQHMRYGGYRPMVFLSHGLMVAFWMMAATLMAAWLWWRGGVRRIGPFPLPALIGVLFVTLLLCKSVGAVFLLFVGLGVMLIPGSELRVRGMRMLILAIPLFLLLRVGGVIEAGPVPILDQIDPRSAQSLGFRLKNEDLLIDKALEQPVFGWGGWGRSRIYDRWGNDISITDGYWIIIFGTQGLVGLLSWLLAMLWPLWALAPLQRRLRAGVPREERLRVVAIGALSVLLTLYVVDCVPNAMINPVFTLVIGACVSTAQRWRRGAPVLAEATEAEPGRRRTLDARSGLDWV
jgi:hypothetical protein